MAPAVPPGPDFPRDTWRRHHLKRMVRQLSRHSTPPLCPAGGGPPWGCRRAAGAGRRRRAVGATAPGRRSRRDRDGGSHAGIMGAVTSPPPADDPVAVSPGSGSAAPDLAGPGPDPGGCWLAGWMDGRSSPTDASVPDPRPRPPSSPPPSTPCSPPSHPDRQDTAARAMGERDCRTLRPTRTARPSFDHQPTARWNRAARVRMPLQRSPSAPQPGAGSSPTATSHRTATGICKIHRRDRVGGLLHDYQPGCDPYLTPYRTPVGFQK